MLKGVLGVFGIACKAADTQGEKYHPKRTSALAKRLDDGITFPLYAGCG